MPIIVNIKKKSSLFSEINFKRLRFLFYKILTITILIICICIVVLDISREEIIISLVIKDVIVFSLLF